MQEKLDLELARAAIDEYGAAPPVGDVLTLLDELAAARKQITKLRDEITWEKEVSDGLRQRVVDKMQALQPYKDEQRANRDELAAACKVVRAANDCQKHGNLSDWGKQESERRAATLRSALADYREVVS